MVKKHKNVITKLSVSKAEEQPQMQARKIMLKESGERYMIPSEESNICTERHFSVAQYMDLTNACPAVSRGFWIPRTDKISNIFGLILST